MTSLLYQAVLKTFLQGSQAFRDLKALNTKNACLKPFRQALVYSTIHLNRKINQFALAEHINLFRAERQFAAHAQGQFGGFAGGKAHPNQFTFR